jgi:ABC-2 type transport system permease protein
MNFLLAAFRYFRLWLSFARFALLNELAFRGNFLLKVFVEVLWLCILLLFYATLFKRTDAIAGWNESQYLFFVGCFFALEGLIEVLFLDNCQEFSQLVRTGNLDTALLQPIDEQFLITLRRVDWSTMPNFLMGAGVMVIALVKHGWVFDPFQALMFVVMFACSLLLAYSFLLLLTASAVWMVRNQSLMELWWLFSSLIRYPREIFKGTWAWPIGFVFTFALPVMLVISVPAEVMVKSVEPWFVAMNAASAIAMLIVSRWFFRRALRRYRSASS